MYKVNRINFSLKTSLYLVVFLLWPELCTTSTTINMLKIKVTLKTYLHISYYFSCLSQIWYEISLFSKGFAYLRISLSKTGV